MIPVTPWYVTLSVVAVEVAIAAASWSVLSAAAGRSGLEPAARRRVRIASAAFLGAWLAAMGAFPMFLVPAFAVPMSALLHVLSFAALGREARPRPISSGAQDATRNLVNLGRPAR